VSAQKTSTEWAAPACGRCFRWVGRQTDRLHCMACACQMPAQRADCCKTMWDCVALACLQALGSTVCPAAAFDFLGWFMLPGGQGIQAIRVEDISPARLRCGTIEIHIDRPACMSAWPGLRLPAEGDTASLQVPKQRNHFLMIRQALVLLTRACIDPACPAHTPLCRTSPLLLQAHGGAGRLGAAAAAPGQAQQPPCVAAPAAQPLMICHCAARMFWFYFCGGACGRKTDGLGMAAVQLGPAAAPT
jgi:hypothetical protein